MKTFGQFPKAWHGRACFTTRPTFPERGPSAGQERSAVNGSPGGRLKSEMEMVYYATRELAKRTEQQQDSWLDSFTAKATGRCTTILISLRSVAQKKSPYRVSRNRGVRGTVACSGQCLVGAAAAAANLAHPRQQRTCVGKVPAASSSACTTARCCSSRSIYCTRASTVSCSK